MNIAVIGRTEMLYDAAELLAQAGHRIKLIVTAREAPEYRRGTEDYRRLAAEVGAGFFTTTKINGKIDTIKEYLPIDMAISMNYVNVIGQDVIDMFPRGILNAHAGDLPRYRGNACVTWAIINGEPRVGLCIHKMVGGQLDTGDIIERDYHPVNIDTKVGEVLAWMGKRVPRMFLDAAAKLEENPGYILEKQNTDPTAGLRCYPRQPGDGEIDWKKNNIEILRLINASSEPFAGAFGRYKDRKLVVWDAELFDDNENYYAVPGQVAQIDKNDGAVIVITGGGKLKLKEIEYDDFRGKPAEVIKSIRIRLE